MMIIDRTRLRDEKILKLMQGESAYAESEELIRLIKKDIEELHLNVFCEETKSRCWFTPIGYRKTS